MPQFDRIEAGAQHSHSAVIAPRPSSSALPLARHVMVRTTDEERATDAATRVASPHLLRTSSGPFEWVLHAVKIGDSTLAYHSYRGAVEVVATQPTDFFVLQVLLRGEAEVSTAVGSTRLAAQGSACVLSPSEQFRMRFAPGTHQVFVRIPVPTIERSFGQLTGEGGGNKVVFDLQTAPQSPWLSNLQLAVHTIDAIGSGAPPSPQLGGELERMIVSSLLLAQPHSASEIITQPATSRASRAVASIVQEIQSAPHQTVEFSELARAHGISLRSLQDGFRHQYGQSPSGFLRDCRLDMAHRLLVQDSQVSVTEAAFSSGFTHLGRFARDYRRRYGASPSTTRHTARASAFSDADNKRP